MVVFQSGSGRPLPHPLSWPTVPTAMIEPDQPACPEEEWVILSPALFDPHPDNANLALSTIASLQNSQAMVAPDDLAMPPLQDPTQTIGPAATDLPHWDDLCGYFVEGDHNGHTCTWSDSSGSVCGYKSRYRLVKRHIQRVHFGLRYGAPSHKKRFRNH